MTKLSIIISTYGRVKYIPELAASLRDQLEEDTEVIVVEGKDHQDFDILTKEESLKEIRARLFFLPRCGICESRNFGAMKASGEWLIFCDDDDVFADSKLKEFREAVRPDYLVYYSNYYVFDEDGPREGSGLRMIVDPRKKIGKLLLFLSNVISGGSAFMIHSSVAKLFPFDEALRGAEDHDLWRRIILNDIPIYFINEKLTGYRAHPSNRTQSHMSALGLDILLFKKYACFGAYLNVAILLHFIKLCCKSFLSLGRAVRQALGRKQVISK